jgi:hypothetical protein
MRHAKLETASSWDRTPAITKRDAPRRTGAYEVREMNGRHASRRISQTRRTNECHLFTLIVVASVFSFARPEAEPPFSFQVVPLLIPKTSFTFPRRYTLLFKLKDILKHHSTINCNMSYSHYGFHLRVSRLKIVITDNT